MHCVWHRLTPYPQQNHFYCCARFAGGNLRLRDRLPGSGLAGCVFEVTVAPGNRGARVEIENDLARADRHFG
jgi:hypothetical protein